MPQSSWTSPATPADPRLAALLLELIAVASPTGEEAALADHVEALLGQTPGGAHLVRHGNGLVLAPPADGRPTLALIGHLDTVPWGGARAPHDDGERIWGRGACDMKAGVACLLRLAQTLPPDAGPHRRVLVFYDREEGPYQANGLEPLLERVPALGELDAALVLEPTAGTLQLGALGSLHVQLVVQGRAAHSARPWQGDNAVYRALPLLAELAACPVRRVEVDGLEFRPSLSVTQLGAGGQARNVLPDRLRANVNVRFSPDQTADEALAELTALVAGRAELTVVDAAPSARPCRNHPLFAELVAAGDLAVQPKQAWTDVARLTARGIAAANFGPGDPELAHRDDEHVTRRELADFAAVLGRFCAGSAARSVRRE